MKIKIIKIIPVFMFFCLIHFFPKFMANAASELSWPITVTFAGGSVTTDPSYYEDFEEAAYGGGAGGWWTVDNSNMVADGLGSTKIEVVNSSIKPYCQVNSNSDHFLNFDDNPYLHLVVSSVDPSTGNLIYLREYPGGIASPTRKLIASYFGAGIYDIDINASDPWSGTLQFGIEIVIESAVNGAGTRFDMLQLYNGDTTAYVEHFEEAAYADGSGEGGWWNYNGNARMTPSSNGSVRLETIAASPTWCEVASNDNHTVNMDTHHYLRVVVPVVDAGIGNIIKLVEQGTGTEKEIARDLGAGTHADIDINATNPWSGPRTFSVHIVIETVGVANVGMEIDEIKIGPEGQ